jgi:hypothetical protein
VVRIKLSSKRVIPLLVLVVFLILYWVHIRQTPVNNYSNNDSFKLTATEIQAKCVNTFLDKTCYVKEFSIISNQYDLATSLKILTNIQKIDPNTRDCHLIAHTIASNQTKKDPSSWQKLLSQIDANTCNGGFVHGVIEEKHNLDSAFVLDKQTIPEICQQVKELNGAEEATCIHIMGHLVLLDTKGDLNQAVDRCLQLPTQHHDRCLGGVFMEYELKDNLIAHGISSPPIWDEEALITQEAICREFKGEVAKACWRELSRVYVLIYPNDPKKIFDNCIKSPDKEAVLQCYMHSMGFIATYPTTSDEVLKQLCSSVLFDKYYFLRCISYVNSYLLSNSLEFIDKSVFICENVPDNYQDGCFSLLGQRLRIIFPNENRQKLCWHIPKNYKALCLEDNLPATQIDSM